jgi:general secretion pathway protein C
MLAGKMELLSRLSRRYFALIVLAFLGCAAALDATGVAAFVSSLLAPDAHALAATRGALRGAPLAASSEHATSADDILSRNPFDSTWHPPDAPRDPGEAPPVTVACDDVRVIGIVGSTEPAYSFAALSVSGEKETLLRRRGGAVGARTVAFVGRDRVYLEQQGSMCEARMFDHPPPAASSSSSATTTAPPPGMAGVVVVSPTERDVDRSVVDRLLENPQELMKVAQLAPEKDGIRIANVRPDSPVAALGVQKGDLLMTIGGYKTSDPQQMLEAYARLRTAERLVLVVQRNGQTLNLEYRIK